MNITERIYETVKTLPEKLQTYRQKWRRIGW